MPASRARRWPRSRGGEPEENAERLKALLQGHGTRPRSEAVAINAGALLFTAGKAADLARGRGAGARHARLGRALIAGSSLVEISNG